MSKTFYLETGSTDPTYNLAFEEYVQANRREGNYLILWQNHNAVIIGRNQNAGEEINREFVQQHEIKVVRRNTGGGAVYHDIGNLNYSFITDSGDIQNRSATLFTDPIVKALRGLGLDAEASGRNDILVSGCAAAGIAAFTGDGVNPAVIEATAVALKKNNGCGVPTVKPWNIETVREKMELVKASDPFAIAMDIDAAGLPFLKNLTPPAGSKTVAELKEIAAAAEKPFILKGIMTVKGALKALEAGASGIVVSNHGGRVLDQCPSTAEVLPAIVDAVGGRMTIIVDGGIRTGMDVFKALALGADGVIIARPFVNMVYGGGAEGIQVYVDKLKAELEDAMAMCGAHSLADINRSMIYGY